MWTEFIDARSGGYQKTPFEYIWIEAPKDEACSVFECRFGERPDAIACPCCGSNFYVTEYEVFDDVIRKFIMSGMIERLRLSTSTVINSSAISDEERTKYKHDYTFTYFGLDDDDD